MKNILFLTLLAAIGLAGVSQAQTRFIDVARLGDGVSVTNSSGTVKVNATVLTKNQRWTRDRVYILANNVIVPNNITLTIEPGTLVRAEFPTVGQGVGAEAALTPADPGAIVVARGGKLIAAGTSDAPIIFTSMDDPNVPGGVATIPPNENPTATSATTNITTVNLTNSRVFSITNTSATFDVNVVFYGSAGVGGTNTNLTYGIAKSTNTLFKVGSTNNNPTNNPLITRDGTTNILTFTNYGNIEGTNTVSTWSVTRPDGINYYNLDQIKNVSILTAAARTFKTNITSIVTNAAGDYTVTGGTLSYQTSSGARKYDTTWAQTNASAFRHDGLWGGIVLCGKSTVNRGYDAVSTNAGAKFNARSESIAEPSINPATGETSGPQRGVQMVEGMAGFSAYSWGGGDEENDDSGILRFVSNRYGGFIIATDVELNSFSGYGVGRNTTMEFLEAWNNADDDFEFWGGDVNLRYSISAFCGDDGLDTDQGYLGVVQYFVQLQNNAVGTDGTSVTGRSTSNYGDSLTENDGPENNASAVPYSTYTLANATLIGRGYGDWSRNSDGSAKGDYVGGPFAGPNFKDNAGARTYNSLIMDNPHGAVMITDRVNSPTDNAFSASGGSSINRFAGTRTSGGFDASGRDSDLTTALTNAPSGPDGLYHNTWFFRNGYAAATTVGVSGVYSNRTAFNAATNNLPVTTADNRFPNSHDRNGRGASANNDVNRANTTAVQAQITDTNKHNVFDSYPGLTAISPYHRLSGLDFRVTGTAKDLPNSALPSYRGLNNQATFVGAVRDNMWMRTWTLGDTLGIYSGSVIVPDVTVTAGPANKPVITFGGEAGVKYVVEVSTDNKTYTKVTTLRATADNNSYTDTARDLGPTPLFYRVIAL
jgi:hypothetical protein